VIKKISMTAAALGLLLALWADSARADTIYLTNGRSVRGRITSRSGGQVTIHLYNGGRITIPADTIDSVEPDDEKPAPKPPENPTPETPKGPEPPATGPAGTPKDPAAKPPETAPMGDGLDMAEIQRKATELAPRIRELLDQLGTEGGANDDKRAQARAELVKIGEPAVELLVGALRDQSILRQELAAGVIAEIGSKRAAKPLLTALDAATPEVGKVSAGNAMVLAAMASAFNRVTGQFFPYDVKDLEDARIVIAQMQAWWRENAEKFPDQVGDPPRPPKPDESKAPVDAPAAPAPAPTAKPASPETTQPGPTPTAKPTSPETTPPVPTPDAPEAAGQPKDEAPDKAGAQGG